jgi:DNA-binding transcriptional MerR regulator
MDGAELASDVIVAVAAAGEEVTLPQLRRWHRAGLISVPKQRALGRGRGTVTVYPAGTSERVLDICRLRQQRCSLEDIRWLLWWEGHDVPAEQIREALEVEAASLRATAAALFTATGLAHDLLNLLDSRPEMTVPSKTFRRSRKRVGVKQFGGFLESLMLAAGGFAEELLDEDIALIDKGLGFDRARTDVLPSGEPWLTSDPRADLIAIGRLFNFKELDPGLHRVDDEELAKARDEVKAFVALMISMSAVIRQGFDRWAYGFGLFGTWAEELLGEPKGQQRLFLMWLALRTGELRAGMETIMEHSGAVAQAQDQLALLEELRVAVPAVGAVISSRELTRAGFKPKDAQALQEKVALLRAEHGAEIDRFFAARNVVPEPGGAP